ncbi:hypothetical protein JCM11641_002204 [Rhodosporidiobolus odoratus]
MSAAILAPASPLSGEARPNKCSTQFSTRSPQSKQKTLSYPQFIRTIESFAQEEAEEIASAAVVGRPSIKRVRLEKRIEELLVEVKAAVICFSLPPFASPRSPLPTATLLRPSLSPIARRVETLYGHCSILSSPLSLPSLATVHLAGVATMCRDLSNGRTDVGRTLRELSRRQGGRVQLETKEGGLVLRPKVEVGEYGGYTVRFELVAGAFWPVEEGVAGGAVTE